MNSIASGKMVTPRVELGPGDFQSPAKSTSAKPPKILERGFEPPTPSLQMRCSAS